MTDFDLGGGGGASFSFGPQGAQPGAYVQGVILDMKEVQKTNFKTNELEFWDNGDPKMQYRVTLQTELRDPTNPQDDGVRNLFLDGRRKPNDNGTKSRLCAVLDACREATGGTKLKYGGKLTVQWISGMGFEGDPRNYAAWYEAPAMDLEQPAHHAQPVVPPQAAAPLQSPGPPPAWAQQQPQAPAQPPVAPPPAPGVQNPWTGQSAAPQAPVAPPAVTPGVAAANPMAPPLQQPATLAGQPNPFAQPGAAGPDPFPAQQAIPGIQQPAAPAQVVAVEQHAQPAVAPNGLAGVVGQGITAEQIAGVQQLGLDPAQVYGPDWQSRVIG